MQYNFTKVRENFPTKTYRSQRTLKKMHLQSYAVTLVSIIIPVDLFSLEREQLLKCLDVICEHDNGSFVCSNGHHVSILTETPTQDEDASTEQFAQNYTNELMYALSNVEMEFANVKTITVSYGDAYYGEW